MRRLLPLLLVLALLPGVAVLVPSVARADAAAGAARADAPAVAAGARVPAAPVFGATIDDYARSETESTCSPAAKPGAAGLGALLLTTYGGTPADVNVSRGCTGAASGHEEGRAIDWMMDAAVPAEEASAQGFLAWLFATDAHGNAHALARRLGVMYIQHDNLMWRSYRKDGVTVFSPLPQYVTVAGVKTPCAALPASYATTCHRNHVHISLSWDGARERTTFWNAAASTYCPVPVPQPVPAVPSTQGLAYVSLPAPYRLLDTRDGTGVGAGCHVGPGGRVDLQVTGRGGLPADGVGAVVLNVAGIAPSAGTYVTVWPAGLARPATSTVNLAAGENRASLVAVPVGSGGMVSLVNNSGTADFVVDVVGYHPAASRPGAALSYHPVAPARVADTRTTGARTPVAGGSYLEIPVAGRAGVPATGAASVVVNVTVDAPEAAGFLSLTPEAPTGPPTTSTVNFGAGRQVANRAYAQLSPTGSLYVWASTTAPVIVDVVGWFGTGTATPDFVPVRPRRVLDTRADKAVGGLTTFRPRAEQSFDVVSRGVVPAGTRAMLATLTGTRPTGRTYVTAWPGGRDRPVASDLNLSAGQSVANLVVIPVGEDGSVDLYNYSGSLDVVMDLLGYYR